MLILSSLLKEEITSFAVYQIMRTHGPMQRKWIPKGVGATLFCNIWSGIWIKEFISDIQFLLSSLFDYYIVLKMDLLWYHWSP